MKIVAGEKITTVALSDIDPDGKIYVFKGASDCIYKLHRVSGDKYAFIGMNDCICYANGVFDSPEEAIKETTRFHNLVYEFEDLEEFCEWVLGEI